MDERRNGMTQEPEFDALLEQSLPDQPPEEVVWETTPWRRAMRRILVGIALQTVTLNFLGLQYFLPGVGQLLLLLGYRTLRRENTWFRFSWIVTVLRSLIYFVTFALNATIYTDSPFTEAVYPWLTVLHVLLQFCLFIALWGAIRAVQRKAGVEVHAGSALGLVFLFALLCFLALVGYQGWLLMLVLLAAYGKIFWNLRKVSRELDEAGYTVTACEVRLSDRALTLLLVGVMLAAIACGYWFFSQYPMNWTPRAESTDESVEEIRDHLLELGFPADVLADLTEEDVLACQDAVRVVSETQDHAMNDGRQVTEQRDGVLIRDTVHDVEELRITGVAVEIAGERERWRLFFHFRWTEAPNFFGTEAIQLPYITQLNEGWIWDRDLSGQVLCELDGRTYTAPYYYLGLRSSTAQSSFWNRRPTSSAFAAFSLPRSGVNWRGYVRCTIAETVDGYLIDTWINYIHQDSWVQYPVRTASDPNRTDALGLASAYRTIWDAIQFSPLED